MRLRRWTAAAAILTIAACAGEPLGPGGLVLEPIGVTADSVLVGAPGRSLAKPVEFRVRDSQGHALAGVTVHWNVLAGNGYVERGSEVTGLDGMVEAGAVPRPLRFNRIIRWPRTTIESWLAAGCPEPSAVAQA